MAVGSFNLYTKAVQSVLEKTMNLASDNFNLILCTNSYTPAPNTDSTYANVSTYELSTGSGYTAGGVTLTTLTVTVSTATVTFDADNVSWSTFTAGPFRYAVLVHRAGGSLTSSDLLLGYVDLTGSGTITGAGGTFAIDWSGSGIFQATHSP